MLLTSVDLAALAAPRHFHFYYWLHGIRRRRFDQAAAGRWKNFQHTDTRQCLAVPDRNLRHPTLARWRMDQEGRRHLDFANKPTVMATSCGRTIFRSHSQAINAASLATIFRFTSPAFFRSPRQ